MFDLDGTLTRPGSSVLAHLGEQLGFGAAAQQLIAGYTNGSLSNGHVSRVAAQELAGYNVRELRHILESLPMVDGIAETVQYLEHNGVLCAISTITFDFAAHYFAERFGFRRVSATMIGVTPAGVMTGQVIAALEREDKCRFITHLCGELQISSQQTLYVGDARPDIPAMKMAGFSVGFNATPDVRNLASVCVDAPDLREVLPHVRAWALAANTTGGAGPNIAATPASAR